MSSRTFRLAIILIVITAGSGWLLWSLTAPQRRVSECVKMRQEFGYTDARRTCKSLDDTGWLKR